MEKEKKKIPDSLFDAMLAMLLPYCETLTREDLVSAIESAMDPFGPLEMLSIDEVCKILHCVRPTLWRLTKLGHLTSYRPMNRTVLYKRRDIMRLIKDGKDKPMDSVGQWDSASDERRQSRLEF